MFVKEKSGKYHFLSLSTKRKIQVAPENLSEKDREWIEAKLNPIPVPPKKPSEITSEASDFLINHPSLFPHPNADRKLIPIIDQTDYGNKANDCVPSTISNFFLWWDQLGYLPIERRGDFDKKSEWLHDLLARNFGTRNTAVTKSRDVSDGVRKYFDRYLKDTGNFRIIQTIGITPTEMHHYCSGVNAVAMEISVYHGQKYSSGHWVALLHADKNGNITFTTWGSQFTGRITKIGKAAQSHQDNDLRNWGYSSYAPSNWMIELDDTSKLPSWFENQEVSFRIEPEKFDGLFIIVPYKYKSPEQTDIELPEFPVINPL